MDDGTILYFEEARTGRKSLALVSIRKYPGATDFETIRNRVVPSYAQSDTGDTRIIVPGVGGCQSTDVLYSPDYMIFGGKNLHGRDVIGYVKVLPNHQMLYLDEVRDKHHQLALDSMRKYPATRNAISVSETLEPTSKNDGGDVLIILELSTGRKTSLTADEIRKGTAYPPMFSRASTGSAAPIRNSQTANTPRIGRLPASRSTRHPPAGLCRMLCRQPKPSSRPR